MTETNEKSDILEVSISPEEPMESTEFVSDNKYFWPTVYIFLSIALVVYVIYLVNEINDRFPAKRAARTLRSIGSAQMAYMGSNNNHEYGSFMALQQVGDCGGPYYTLGDMINGYSMTWNVGKIPGELVPECPYPVFSTYTVIAYPRYPKYYWRELSTFGITDDNIDPEPIVRRYSPENGDDVSAVLTWDPIL
jgi:hypothetical protein